MYSCVFWCESIDLVGFLAVIVWPLSKNDMGHIITAKKPTRKVSLDPCCVTDCYFIVNELDLPFASPFTIYC